MKGCRPFYLGLRFSHKGPESTSSIRIPVHRFLTRRALTTTSAIPIDTEMANKDSEAFVLPKLPVPHKDFIPYLSGQRAEDIQRSVAPYNEYEAKLREGFAQHRDHESLQDPKVNAVPIFDGNSEELRIRVRATDDQSLNEKYIMPLNARDRKPEGSNATVASIQDFKKNFNLFSESSLVDFDWSNVVAAGSSVVTALLPVPDKYNTSKKALR